MIVPYNWKFVGKKYFKLGRAMKPGLTKYRFLFQQVASSLSDIQKGDQGETCSRVVRSNDISPDNKECRPISRPDLDPDDSPRKSSFASRASFYKESSTSETSLFEEPTSTCFKICRDILRMLKNDRTFKFSYRLSAQEGEAMSRLWADAGVRQCFQHSKSYQLVDCAEYVLDNLEKIADPGYTPTADVRTLYALL